MVDSLKNKDNNDKNKNKEIKSRDPKGHRFLLYKILFIAVLGAFLVIVYRGADAKDIDLAEVDKLLMSDADFTAIMKEQNERELMQFIGINSNDYDQVLYYRNTEALAVEEILIVKASDASALSGVEDAVQRRIDSQIKAYDSYGPEQVKMLKNAAVEKRGKYYIYCTADKAAKYEEVVLHAIQ